MATRRPLVLSGGIRELPDGDRLLGVREQLTAARTYYVRTDGNDSNTGMANTAGGAFLTLQRALTEAGSLDLGTHDLTIQLGAGTYNGSAIGGATVGSGRVLIVGNVASPGTVSVTSSAILLQFTGTGKYRLSGVTLSSTGGSLLSSLAGCDLEIGNVVFGATSAFGAHMYCDMGSLIRVIADYAITAGAWYHVRSVIGGIFRSETAITVTLTGTPAFTGAFVQAIGLSLLYFYNATFSGSATGVRYNVTTNAIVFAAGAGANYYPGNAAGTSATGGQYS